MNAPHGTALDTVLQELATTPGLLGAFVHHAREGVLASTLPPSFAPARIQAMGKAFSKIQAAGNLNFKGLADITLSVGETTVFLQGLPEKACIALVGGASFNANAASLSLHLVEDELKEALAARQTTGKASPSPSVNPEDLLNAMPLGPTLQGMRTALGKVIGPMAGVIFMECLEQWAGSCEPNRANLSGLLAMIERETGDPERAATYRKLVSALPERP